VEKSRGADDQVDQMSQALNRLRMVRLLEISSRNSRTATLETLGPAARRPDPRPAGRGHGRSARRRERFALPGLREALDRVQ
jgi:hypothetical protein